jgi:pyrroline-5-carboxylate reductase
VQAPYDPVGFVGAGSLATALATGLLASGVPAEALWVGYRTESDRLGWFRARGIRLTRDKAALARAARTLVLLVKPADADAALAELRDHLTATHRVVSCLAGVPTGYLEAALGGRPRVLRAMPNLASAVRASVTALCPGRSAGPEDAEAVGRLFARVGLVVPVVEDDLDAVTAVAGSGPAYVYLLMEALTDAAVDLGLPRDTAAPMVLQTVLGAAELAAASPRSPAELRASVTSKGGTTQAALEVLEAAGFRDLVARAVARARDRSRALGARWQPAPEPRDP